MLGAAACLVFLVPASAACLYWLALTVAGLLPHRRAAEANAELTFAVLIPAHDEEGSLPATLRSVAALDYPADRVRVLVVADNCTDGTAAVARAHGADCVVREDRGRCGKGFAVAHGMNALRHLAQDVVLILDADCELSPNSLREFAAAFTGGAVVAQAAVRSRNADDGPGGYVAAVGAAVDDAVARGRQRLGGSAPLRGTGMAFGRSVLDQIQWDTASAVEDADYARQLRAAGLSVRLCGGAVVSCDAPAAVGDLCRQRRRWVGTGPLASKPLGLVHLLATVAVCAASGAFGWWAAGLVLLTAAVYGRAVLAVGLSRRRVGLVLLSPVVVMRLVGVALTGLARGSVTTWDRTPRPLAGRAA